MIHSSSIPDRTIKSFRKYCSVMRLSRIMANSLFFQMPIKAPKSNLVMKWNYLQQHTSNTKNWIKTEAKDRTRISRKQHLDRFNQHPIKRGTSQWDSQELQTMFKMLLSKKLLNRLVVSKPVTTIQIKEDHLRVWSILQLLALTKCRYHNPTKGLFLTKTPRVLKINHPKNQAYPSNSLQASTNSKRRSSSLVTIFWSSMSTDWWTRLRLWMMRVFCRISGRGLSRSSSPIMSGTHRTEERLKAQWQALSRD